MKFDIERIKAEIHFISAQSCMTDVPLTGDFRMGFRVGDPIELGGDKSQLAVIELGFSGFQLIETTEEPLGMLGQIGAGPYALSGAGFLRIHESLYTLEDGETLRELKNAPSKEEQQFWLGFTLQSIADQYNIREPLIYCLQNAVGSHFADGTVGLGLCFTISKPCSEENWKKRLALHKLEVEAAELYLESIGGNMDGVGTPDMTALDPGDLADNRVLN